LLRSFEKKAAKKFGQKFINFSYVPVPGTQRDFFYGKNCKIKIRCREKDPKFSKT
jgi:hypothetical protein